MDSTAENVQSIDVIVKNFEPMKKLVTALFSLCRTLKNNQINLVSKFNSQKEDLDGCKVVIEKMKPFFEVFELESSVIQIDMVRRLH